jgi:hypothetical protein
VALIYRALFNVEQPGFVGEAPQFAQEWVRWKLRRDDIVLVGDGEIERDERGVEARWWYAEDGGSSVFRAMVYEDRHDDAEQVRTTFTAFGDGPQSWVLTDIERWATSSEAHPWVPHAPRIVGSLLEQLVCHRGEFRLPRTYKFVGARDAAALARALADSGRELPVVVLSSSQREDLSTAKERAGELAKCLAGVAPIFLLGRRAVSAFSRETLKELGEGMDVYGGAIRIYNPGAGSATDSPYRHRLVPFRRFEGRSSTIVTRLIAAPLLSRATETPPPPIWRERIRELLESSGGDDAELLALYEEETQQRKLQLDELSALSIDLQERQDELEGENVELLGELDSLRGRVRYLQTQLAELDAQAAYVDFEPDPFVPDWCGEVVSEAQKRLDMLVIPDSVRAGAEALDEHANASWGRRAWSAFQALQAYGEAKQTEFAGDFMAYCERSDGVKIPASWIGRHESKITKETARFRDLRTLPVDREVSSEGEIFMEEHIKIQQGGTPSPRIHYFDDTGGTTRKIHIGWFGDHLNSRAKS